MIIDVLSFSIIVFFSSSFKEKSIITDLFISDDYRIVIKLINTILINY